SPWVFVEVLRECGALRALLPEVDQLFGRPGGSAEFPDIDAGTHALLALKAACELSEDAVVRYASLLHGVKETDAIGERLRVPRELSAVASLVARHCAACHRVGAATAEESLRLLESVDAFRRPQQLEQFLLGCEAEMRGWPVAEGREYRQGVV